MYPDLFGCNTSAVCQHVGVFVFHWAQRRFYSRINVGAQCLSAEVEIQFPKLIWAFNLFISLYIHKVAIIIAIHN